MAWSLRRAAIGGFAAIGILVPAGYFFLSMAQQSRNWTACMNAGDTVAPDLAIAGCTAVAPSIILTPHNRATVFIGRGNAREAKYDFDSAIADYSVAIRLDPNDRNGYRERGLANFYAAHYGAAIADLARALAAKPSDAYPALWLYIARARTGDQSADAKLAADAKKLAQSDWPYAVVELYLGQRTPEATLAAPAKPDDRCEAQFYIGEWQLLHADRPAAIESLRTAASTCPKDFMEFVDAQAELKRLGQ
jgi:lipoprotein NlpI